MATIAQLGDDNVRSIVHRTIYISRGGCHGLLSAINCNVVFNDTSQTNDSIQPAECDLRTYFGGLKSCHRTQFDCMNRALETSFGGTKSNHRT